MWLGWIELNFWKKGCYLHSVQHSYENRSCKPEIKYFTNVIQWITLVKYLISGLQLLFCGSNGYYNTSDSGGSNVHIGLHM